MCLQTKKLRPSSDAELGSHASVPLSSQTIQHNTHYIKMIHRRRNVLHDDVIKWRHFPRYWPFVRGIHRSPVNSPHKGQWRGALMLSFIWAWINGWVNNREAGDLRRHRAHYDVTVIITFHECVANRYASDSCVNFLVFYCAILSHLCWQILYDNDVT